LHRVGRRRSGAQGQRNGDRRRSDRNSRESDSVLASAHLAGETGRADTKGVTSLSFAGRQSTAIAAMTLLGPRDGHFGRRSRRARSCHHDPVPRGAGDRGHAPRGDTEYILQPDGIRRRRRSLFDARRNWAPREEFLPWDEGRSFHLEKDLSRSLQQIESFELHRPRGASWIATERQDPAGFAAFRAGFLERMRGRPEVPRRPGSYWRPVGRRVRALACVAALRSVTINTPALDLHAYMKSCLRRWIVGDGRKPMRRGGGESSGLTERKRQCTSRRTAFVSPANCGPPGAATWACR
jgi:hypothetical protein